MKTRSRGALPHASQRSPNFVRCPLPGRKPTANMKIVFAEFLLQ